MKRSSIFLFAAIFLFGTVAITAAETLQDIKGRMIDRLPVIETLKSKGILGENNRGYLEYVDTEKPRAEVVEAENKDRRKVYSAIANQQGTTVDLVEKHRAAQITQKADSGEFLQDAHGKWYRKK